MVTVEQSIVMVRGEKVILDYVLAEMYGVSTKALVQAVQRNLDGGRANSRQRL